MSILMNSIYGSIALFGDSSGINQLLQTVPNNIVKCIVGASNRPQYHSELKKISEELNCGFLIQPVRNKKEYSVFLQAFISYDAEIILCKSYSMILREELLQSVNFNAINFHASLLPANRGANPENWAIIKGERETGLTLHYMSAEIDGGDIIAQRKIEIDIDDTWVSLLNKIKMSQVDFLQDEIEKIIEGKNSRMRQELGDNILNKRLTPEFPEIEFDKMSDMQIYNLIRAQVHPLMGAYILKNKQRIYFNEFIPLEEIPELREKYY